MGRSILRTPRGEIWRLVESQHGVVARAQLLELGLSADAIDHRLGSARLHPVAHGVYAVGRPGLSRHGRWMAAVLACGDAAVLSHRSASALWGMTAESGRVEVTIPPHVARRRPGVLVYRRALADEDRAVAEGIPVTSVRRTLVDLGGVLRQDPLEAAINAADKLDLVDPESLRAALDAYAGRPGVAALRRVLERSTFVLTDSQLERRFLPIARKAGLPRPLTGRYVNGFKVDFLWLDIRLIVETDGLRYHRTPAQQARDRLRDQAHTGAGFTPLRFTHAQVRYEPLHVEKTLAAVARRLRPPE